MNNTIKELVHQYLDNTYKLEIATLSDYMVILKFSNRRVPITTMYEDIIEIFNLHPYNCREYFNTWIDSASLKLNNDSVDDLYEKYAKSRGLTILHNG